MMAKPSKSQRTTVERVMHEWNHGELESSHGGKVRRRRQAVAIALSEAGGSSQQSPRQNQRQYARTKSKERHGQTAMQHKEGGGRGLEPAAPCRRRRSSTSGR
jgi:hypothetical protein